MADFFNNGKEILKLHLPELRSSLWLFDKHKMQLLRTIYDLKLTVGRRAAYTGDCVLVARFVGYELHNTTNGVWKNYVRSSYL